MPVFGNQSEIARRNVQTHLSTVKEKKIKNTTGWRVYTRNHPLHVRPVITVCGGISGPALSAPTAGFRALNC